MSRKKLLPVNHVQASSTKYLILRNLFFLIEKRIDVKDVPLIGHLTSTFTFNQIRPELIEKAYNQMKHLEELSDAAKTVKLSMLLSSIIVMFFYKALQSSSDEEFFECCSQISLHCKFLVSISEK